MKKEMNQEITPAMANLMVMNIAASLADEAYLNIHHRMPEWFRQDMKLKVKGARNMLEKAMNHIRNQYNEEHMADENDILNHMFEMILAMAKTPPDRRREIRNAAMERFERIIEEEKKKQAKIRSHAKTAK